MIYIDIPHKCSLRLNVDIAQGKGENECYVFCFCLNLSFTIEGKKIKCPLHRKQFLFQRRDTQLAVSAVPQLRCCSLFPALSHSPGLAGIKGKDMSSVQSGRGPFFSFGIPFSSCLCLPGKVRWPMAGTHSRHRRGLQRAAQTSLAFGTGAISLILHGPLDLTFISGLVGKPWLGLVSSRPASILSKKGSHVSHSLVCLDFVGVGDQWPNNYNVRLWSLVLGQLERRV